MSEWLRKAWKLRDLIAVLGKLPPVKQGFSLVALGKAFLPLELGCRGHCPAAAPGGLLPPQLPAVSLAFPVEVQYFTVLLGRSTVVLCSEVLSKLCTESLLLSSKSWLTPP